MGKRKRKSGRVRDRGSGYLLVVRASDGSVVRCLEYGSYSAAVYSDARPTLAELLLGHSATVRHGGGRASPASEPINPKVRPLVAALYLAGAPTTCSGDMYRDDMVYVDLDPAWEPVAAAAALPDGWVAAERDIAAVLAALGMGANPYDQDGRRAPRVRLSRAGGPVSGEEATAVVAAVLESASRLGLVSVRE